MGKMRHWPDLLESLRLARSEVVGRSTRWVVLTGAPGAGKSTLLAALAQSGISVRQEQAQILIGDLLKRGTTTEHIRQQRDFLVSELFKRNRAVQLETDPEELVIFDRSLPDVLAFGTLDGVDVRPLVAPTAAYRFAAAIVFSHIALRDDGTIYHSPEELAEVAGYCSSIYSELGTRTVSLSLERESLADATLARLAVVKAELKRITND